MTRALVAALAAAALFVGCGDSADEDGQPAPRAAETPHSVPDLPRGWETHVNLPGGFALGLPPGWRARDRGTTTEIRSFDGLVVLTIAADRTGEALELDPAEAASRTLGSLPGFAEPIEPGASRRFEHRYDAHAVRGSGRARGSVDQELKVVVLRRDDLVTITVLVAANADRRARPARRIADRAIRTLRTRPPSTAAR